MAFRSALTRLNLTRTWQTCLASATRNPNLPLTTGGPAHRSGPANSLSYARNISFWSRKQNPPQDSPDADPPKLVDGTDSTPEIVPQAPDTAQAADAVTQTTDAVVQATDASTAAIVSQSAADYLQAFHESVSFGILPWSATIPLAAVALRLISFPLVYYNQVHAGRFMLASKEFPRIQYFVKNTPGTLVQKYSTFRRLRNLALKSAGTSPLRVFRWHIVTHLPLVIAASMGMREMARRVPEEWRVGGFGWIGDLTVADPMGVLPVLTTGLWLWNLDPKSSPTAGKSNDGKKIGAIERIISGTGESMARILQVGAVVSLSVTTELPAGIVLFWLCNGVVTSAQRFGLSNDVIRRKIDLLTAEDVREMQGPAVMEGTGMAVEKVREELSYIQREVVSTFKDERVDDKLCLKVDKMLQRERWNGRISMDLEAVIREDDRDGKKYVAIIRKGAVG